MAMSKRNMSNAPDATTKHHKIAGRINQKHNHGMSSKTTKRRANKVSQIQEAAAHQAKTVESSKVAKPAKSTESAECTEISKFVEPVEYVEAVEPTEPADPTWSTEPAWTAEFVEPVEFVQPVEFVEQVKYDKYEEAAEAAEATNPTEPAEPAVPNEPSGLFVCPQSFFDSSLPPLMYHPADIPPEVALAVDIAVGNLMLDPVINQQCGLDSIPRQGTTTEHEIEADASESDISSLEPASDRYEADGELTSDSDESEPEPDYDTEDYIPNTDSDSDSDWLGSATLASTMLN